VDGQEITQTELQAELVGVNLPNDPKIRKAAEQQALQAIIVRKLLAQAARDQGLDKTPAFILQEQRLTDTLLGQDVQTKFANEVPAPSREEAERFVTDHPDIFAQRKIYTVDQLRMLRPTDPKLMKEIEPLNTLADIESLLTRENIPYKSGNDTIDAVGSNPQLIDAIVKLPPNAVFVYPSGNLALIDQVRETKVVPFTGEPAINYALQLIKRQRTQDAVARQVHSILTNSKNVIRYNPAYQPPKVTAPPPAASSAPVSGAPAAGT